jgi:hypothetical protein
MQGIIETEERALRLSDSFLKGSRHYVVREIMTEDAPTAAILAAHVVYALCQQETDGPALPPDAAAFLIFLERERRWQLEGGP